MSLREYIKADYQEYLTLNRFTMPDGLYEALKCNERLPKFLEKLEEEIVVVDQRIGIDRIQIKNIVYDMTAFFIKLVATRAQEQQMSQLEKSRLIADDKAKALISDEEAVAYKEELISRKLIIEN